MPEASMVGILQARTSSTRLPGKVLKPILGRPMLARQIERLKRCRSLDRLVVATSLGAEDDPLERLCREEGVDCFRGSLSDVLDRFYQCALQNDAGHVVRLTGDCPLADHELIDSLIGFYLGLDVDYASNCRPPTLPDGLDAEVFRFEALAEAWREATDPFEREHVVPYIVRRPGRFRLANWSWTGNAAKMRWTVDEPEDFEFVTRVYQCLHPGNPDFGFRDVLELVAKRPDLTSINQGFNRNEGSRNK
jgi:spore coat polysaccharide biosynthesis protein SpsF (cytidylyltransferase family)